MIQADLETPRPKIGIMAYLAGSGFPRNLTAKLYKKCEVRTKEILVHNPYLLLSYDGCGFQIEDKFALKNGYNPLRLKRQALFLLDSMESYGDVWLEEKTLQSLLVKQFRTAAKFSEVLKLLNRAKRIHGTNLTSDGTRLSGWFMAIQCDFETEQFIAKDVKRRLQTNYEIQIDTASLTDSQTELLKIVTSQRMGGFTGGPGTGKTYTVARYIKGFVDGYGNDAILMVAPTGKAVVRSRELLASIGVECDASTLHSYIYGKGMVASTSFAMKVP